MNVSRCIRKGLQSVACTPGLEPLVNNKSRRALVHPGYRGITTTLVFSKRYISSSSGIVGKQATSNRCISQLVGGRFSRMRCAATEEGVAGSEASNKQAWRLIMYSKPGCCLCDGLKEKLSTLPNVDLEIRNILMNPEWENAYQYEIPVLAHVREDGTEETIPRLSPRLSAEQMHKKLGAVLS
ncbi:hypothetical protein R1flu_007334 [Riccia fluitans]|uniref:Glutaredoxin-like protein n=1 Tax=Riccia fluitans TaxID=41844 RepID=A0ABD1YYK6_9MARC